jgi:protein AroM
MLLFHEMSEKRAAFITIGESPRDDIVGEMRPFFPELDVVQYGALDGIAPDQVARLGRVDAEELLVSRLKNGTEVLLRADWVHHRVMELVATLDDEAFDFLVLLCTGRFEGLTSRRLVVQAQAVVDHGIAAFAGRTGAIGVLLPHENQKVGFTCEPAGDRPFLLSHASPYSGDRWEEAAGELDEAELIVLHCMGYTEAQRASFAARTGKPVLLARRLLAAAVAQLV